MVFLASKRDRKENRQKRFSSFVVLIPRRRTRFSLERSALNVLSAIASDATADGCSMFSCFRSKRIQPVNQLPKPPVIPPIKSKGYPRQMHQVSIHLLLRSRLDCLY